MTRARLVPVLTALGTVGTDQAVTWPQVCAVSAEVLGVDEVSIMLMAAGGIPATLGVTGPIAAALEEAQFTLGEGPCTDAFNGRRPVEAADLAVIPAVWIAFTERAVRLGVLAVTALPLLVGAARLGSLSLYRTRPGTLTGERFADALAVADLISQAVLAAQANAPADRLARELDGHQDGWPRAEVHQASGRVAVQLSIGVAEALVRLRTHAYAHNRPIDAVAADVMDGTLRLE